PCASWRCWWRRIATAEPIPRRPTRRRRCAWSSRRSAGRSRRSRRTHASSRRRSRRRAPLRIGASRPPRAPPRAAGRGPPAGQAVGPGAVVEQARVAAHEPVAAAVVAQEPGADGGAAPQTVVVVDPDGAWERRAPDGYHVVVVAPSQDVATQVAAAHPVRVVVNLAAPGGLAQLVALRAHGVSAPIF